MGLHLDARRVAADKFITWHVSSMYRRPAATAVKNPLVLSNRLRVDYLAIQVCYS